MVHGDADRARRLADARAQRPRASRRPSRRPRLCDDAASPMHVRSLHHGVVAGLLAVVSPVPVRRPSLAGGGAAALACACVAIPAFVAGGGYFPSWWGWFTFAPLVVVAVVLATRRGAISRDEALFVAGLALFVVWTAFALLWTKSVPRTVNEVERDAIYVAAVSALVLVRRTPESLAAGALAATTAIAGDALVSRLLDGGDARLDG